MTKRCQSQKFAASLHCSLFLLATSFVFLPTVASATVLTFDQGTVSNFEAVDLTYGDDVEATLEGTFGYGVGAEGFTPNVQLFYGATQPALWTTGFGDLVNVLYDEDETIGLLTVTLTADSGFQVQLYEFDLADFSATSSTINSVRVSDVSGVLFQQLNAVISNSTSTPFDFTAAPLTASQLIIEIDSTNLGISNDNIGIDNIRFGQTAIPEPSTFVLALLSLLGMGCRRRKRA